MTGPPSRDQVRRRLLESRGVGPPTIDAVLAYGDGASTGRPEVLPLPDEPHVAAWQRYAIEARMAGAIPTLTRHFAQMRFPIEAGISGRDAYREATRRGRFEIAAGHQTALALRRPDRVFIEVVPTMGGGVPTITAEDRDDFAALVRAFTARNEPAPVPPAMGACLVRGLNNWSRVADYKSDWEARRPANDSSAWSDEFQRLAARKDLYQDRIVLLSAGPYSAIPAGDTTLDPADWLARSLIIRREHELTHYFTYRVFGWLRDHLLDEILADFVGLLHAFGRYQPALALQCLGLDETGVRPDGRFWIYRGQPRLSDDAMTVVAGLTVDAVGTLAAIDSMVVPSTEDLASMARLTLAIYSLSLEELASPGAVDLALSRLSSEAE